MERFAFIHPHFSAFFELTAECRLSVTNNWNYYIEHTVLRPLTSCISSVSSFGKGLLLFRVLSFSSYLPPGNIKNMVNFFSFFSLKERTGRVETRFPDWPTDWLLTFSLGVRQCALYLYIYVFCDFCIDVSAKKEEMKGHCWSQHHNKQSNVAFVITYFTVL